MPDVTIVTNGETDTLTGEQHVLQVTEQGVTECISGFLVWTCAHQWALSGSSATSSLGL
jgi:hypothetical protein